MGRPKPLLAYRGGTLLGALAESLAAGGVERIWVVAAAGDRELARWVVARPRLRLAVNPRPSQGMLSSLLAGLQAMGGADAVSRRGAPLVVCPADHPAVRAQTVRELLARSAAGAGLVVPVHAGRRGHPLVVGPRRVAEIPRLDPAVGLRQLLDRHPEEVVEVEIGDPGVVADVDTPADYAALDP